MAKFYGWAKKYYEERKNDPDFITSGIVVEILDNFSKKMKEKNITRAELARRLGKSKAYVTRLLQGDYDNLTIKTLVELALALNEKPENFFGLFKIFGDHKSLKKLINSDIVFENFVKSKPLYKEKEQAFLSVAGEISGYKFWFSPESNFVNYSSEIFNQEIFVNRRKGCEEGEEEIFTITG